MMMIMKFSELRTLAWPSIAQGMETTGYIKNKKNKYLYEKVISEDWRLSIGFNTAGRQGRNHFLVNPILAISYTEPDRIFTRLTGRTTIETRLLVSIGYVMPENDYIEWDYYTGCEPNTITANLMNAIKTFALPFMDQCLQLENFIENYKRFGFMPYIAFHIPILYYVQGDCQAAKDSLNMYLKLSKDQNDFSRGAPMDYQEFYDIMLPELQTK